MTIKSDPSLLNIASWIREIKKLANSPEPGAREQFNQSADQLINSLTRLNEDYKIVHKSFICE